MAPWTFRRLTDTVRLGLFATASLTAATAILWAGRSSFDPSGGILALFVLSILLVLPTLERPRRHLRS